jgi:hypothetical protein
MQYLRILLHSLFSESTVVDAQHSVIVGITRSGYDEASPI